VTAFAAEEVLLPVLGAKLCACLVKPQPPAVGAVVVGVVGAGTRVTSANRFVADTFARAGLSVLVVELLTEEEDEREGPRTNLPLLAERLGDAAEWLAFRTGVVETGVGLVGLGAAGEAALVAAAAVPDLARAVVCAAAPLHRAGTAVMLTEAPTLVLVGDQDRTALKGCERLVASMRCEHRMEILHGAGPRLDEPGVLDQAVNLATSWLRDRLTPRLEALAF